VVVQLLVGGRAGGDDPQEVVRLAEQALSLDDLGDGRDGLVEVADHFRPGQGREHEHLECQVKGGGVDLDLIAA